VPAILAAAGGFVFEEFHGAVTDRAGDAEDGIGPPISTVLTGAFHFFLQLFTTESTEVTEIKNKNQTSIMKAHFKRTVFPTCILKFDLILSPCSLCALW
jgi:hypothetical protein